METGTIILIIVGLYLLVSLLTGIIPALKISSGVDGYVAGDRSMNVFILYFVLGASIFPPLPSWAGRAGPIPGAPRHSTLSHTESLG
jgi:hypothetical protein